MRSCKFGFLVAVAAMMCTSAFAADLYVSATTGKKKGPGTKEAPFKNLWKAIETAQPGDTIHVAEGNYGGKLNCGWIEIDKGVNIIASYAPDFSSRDVVAHASMLKPTNEQNATKPKGGGGTVTINVKGADSKLTIDGLTIDQGDANSYHPIKGKPEGLDTGMWLKPPAKGNTQFPSIDSYAMSGKSDGEVVIKNCTFVNASNYALNLNHFSGSVKVLNNLFVNSRMMAANVSSANAKPFVVSFEFAYNTVLFTWSRTSEMTDMGYGVRALTGVESSIHHNILGLNVGSGFDNTMGDTKQKKVKLDNNVFFLNKVADVTVTVSPNIKKLRVDSDEFEDLEDIPGIESLEGNTVLKSAAAFKDILDETYLNAFLSASYSEKTDYDENSPANIFREAFGINKQGTITTKVSMFCNRYPVANIGKLFGAIEGAGAQKVQ